VSNERGKRDDGLLEIRPSMLSDYGDCGLRAVVRSYPWLFTAKGFTPRIMIRSVAAAVGTAVHKFVSHSLKTYQASGTEANVPESIEAAVNEYEVECKELDPKLSIDDQTPKLSDGKIQVTKLSHLYQQHVGYKTLPEMVEERIEARLGEEAILSGQPDHTVKSRALIDIKTGSRHSIHQVQTSGYVALLEAHKKPIRKVMEVFLRRMKVDKPLEVPTISEYSADSKPALFKAQRLIADLKVFEATSNPMVSFPTNDRSILCSEKWCSAYKTDICSMWRAKEGE
jgi:hypothetical protein